MAKLQGKINNWNDDKGFGFVQPNDGGVRAFVHIKAFNTRSRRPENGDVIIYELVKENNNRYKANNINFASEYNKVRQRHVTNNSHKNSKPKNNILGLLLTVCFCIGLTLAVFKAKIPVYIGFAYLIISLITILVYAKDKYATQSDRWRTPEATLHSLSLIGGWPGALFAQKILRHKTSKNEFISTYRFTVFLNVVALFLLFTKQGQSFLHGVVLPLLSEAF
ncbi:DUF1294 domain-containing protein [Psychromonas sp. KJ10-10]|uniref:DUF1294 domain-containing protein n=1 Tax=Psychromonas sp. KJ10-10 TaxID=3391823 RepID=UPI0039B654F8